ncbi:MAG: exo-alpha-sialidase [Clostridia bacterium]|nr:exo-alpha-sialidase [Clostridia bacterium]MBN2883667.1 exo-alpha-sialidase [Clostridia bacterium]
MNKKYINCTLLYEDSVNNMNRVVRLGDGSLFTLGIIKRDINNMGSYPKRQFIFSRRSNDEGITWSQPEPLFEIPETRKFVGLGQFMISREGVLHVFMYRISERSFEKNRFRGDILHARMDDIAGTNLKIQKIECLDRYTGALNNLIQLDSGRIVVPFSTLNDENGVFQSSTIFSDDDGISWSVSNQVDVISEETDVESGAVEPVVAEVEENKLVMIIRTVLGSFFYSISKDGGASWSESKKSNIKSSNAPAVLQKMKDGSILIVWNNCNGMPMRGVRYSMARQCLHAAVSDDGLKTLRGVRMIVSKTKGDPDDVLNCYPFSSPASDSAVFIRMMTVQSKDGETWQEPNAKLILLETDFLNETGLNEGFGSTCIKATDEKPGYEFSNFSYRQKGSIKMSYESTAGVSKIQLILSDNYIDVSSFNLSKDDEQYREYINENYISVPVAIKSMRGTIKIEWDNEITIDCNGEIFKMPNGFSGFNHLGILVSEGEITVNEISEQSEKAWLDTGIEY